MPSIISSTILGILVSDKADCAALGTFARPAMVGPAPPPFGGAGPWPSPVVTARMGAGRAGKGMCGHASRDWAAADDRAYRVHPDPGRPGGPAPEWPAGIHPGPRLRPAAAARRGPAPARGREGARVDGRGGARADPGRARHRGPGHRLRPEAGGQAGPV